MEPQFGLTRIPCPTHPTEPVVKVSLDATDQKLLYCIECLESITDASKKANFVKFQDFIQTLYEQYSELLSASVEAPLSSETKEFLSHQEQAQIDFSREMKKQKTTADQEIKKIEKQISELLQAVRTSSHTRLDQFETAIKVVFEEYNQKVSAQKDILSGSTDNIPSQSVLNKKIFDTNSTEEAEKNLRSILKELENKKELRKGTAFEEIQRIQTKLESAGENKLIVPEKSDKDYSSQIKLFIDYFEALLSSIAEEPPKEDDKKEEDADSELTRQKQSSETLNKGLLELEKQLQPSYEKIESILEKKFKLEVTDWECPVSKNGVTPVEGRAYKCVTCISKNNEFQDSDIVCEDCRNFCHRGHHLEYVGTQTFVCQCQFALGDICQLATDCLYRYSTSNSYRMATYKCKVCEMSSSRVLCGFCAKQCHEQHGYTFHTMQNTYCDCRGLFTFCKYHELGNNNQ